MVLYISDLDGTLLDIDGKLSQDTIKILKPMINEGFPFTIATGRALYSTIEIIETLEITLPVILLNGAYIYDPIDKKIIAKNCLDKDVAKFILSLCDEYNLHPFIFCADSLFGEKNFYKEINSTTMEEIFVYRRTFDNLLQEKVYTYDDVLESEILQIHLFDEESALRPLYEKLLNLNVVVYMLEDDNKEGYYWLEVISPETSKGVAISKLKMHLKARELVCFGDNLNDLSMFHVAEYSYAMENAVEKLKEISKGVIGKNCDHSVAKFLENISKVW